MQGIQLSAHIGADALRDRGLAGLDPIALAARLACKLGRGLFARQVHGGATGQSPLQDARVRTLRFGLGAGRRDDGRQSRRGLAPKGRKSAGDRPGIAVVMP